MLVRYILPGDLKAALPQQYVNQHRDSQINGHSKGNQGHEIMCSAKQPRYEKAQHDEPCCISILSVLEILIKREFLLCEPIYQQYQQHHIEKNQENIWYDPDTANNNENQRGKQIYGYDEPEKETLESSLENGHRRFEGQGSVYPGSPVIFAVFQQLHGAAKHYGGKIKSQVIGPV